MYIRINLIYIPAFSLAVIVFFIIFTVFLCYEDLTYKKKTIKYPLCVIVKSV